MAGTKNLKPMNQRTKAEQREIAQKGGIASGKARRERKALKEELLALLEDGDTQEKVCLALISQAKRGNIRAFEVLRDAIGESGDKGDEAALDKARDLLGGVDSAF